MNLSDIIRTVENNVTTTYLYTVNPKFNLCRHVVDGRSCCPFHCPILVSVGLCIKLKAPGNVYVTVDNATDIVKGCCTHNVAVCIKNLNYEAFLGIAPNFAPDSIAYGITGKVVALRKLYIITVKALGRKTFAIKGYGNLTCRSSRHSAVCFILAGTDSTPKTVCVCRSHSVCALENNVIVFNLSLTNNYRNECADFAILNCNCIIIDFTVQTNTVFVVSCINLYVFNSCTNNSTKRDTTFTLNVGILNSDVIATLVLKQGSYACGSTAINYNLSRLVCTDCCSAVICISEGTVLDSKNAVAVLIHRVDKVLGRNLCRSNKVDILNNNVLADTDFEFTGKVVVITIDSECHTGCLIDINKLLSNVSEKCDCLTVLNCINSSLESLVLNVADLCYVNLEAIYDRINHCSVTVSCSFNSYSLVFGCIDTYRCIFTVITMSSNLMTCTIYLNCYIVSFISCNVNYNIINLIRNCKGNRTNCRRRSKFYTNVTLNVTSCSINLTRRSEN